MVAIIGRALMYTLIVGLALFVAANYFLIDNSSDASEPNAEAVSIHDLTTNVEKYKGHLVVTTGILSYSEEHGQYQVTGDGNYAVVIRGFGDEQLLEALNGREVHVTGAFGVSGEDGTFIQAQSVTEVIEE